MKTPIRFSTLRRPAGVLAVGSVAILSLLACAGSSAPVEPGASAIVDPGGKAATAGAMRQAVTLSLATSNGLPALVARARITNMGAQPIRLEFGACSLQLLAYRTADRSGSPAWNSDQRRSAAGSPYACPMYLAMRDLAPGASIEPGELALTAPLVEVLGDSLPDGRYYFAAQIRTNLSVATPIDAGAADLALERAGRRALRR